MQQYIAIIPKNTAPTAQSTTSSITRIGSGSKLGVVLCAVSMLLGEVDGKKPVALEEGLFGETTDDGDGNHSSAGLGVA